MSEDGYIEKEGYAREGYVLFFVRNSVLLRINSKL